MGIRIEGHVRLGLLPAMSTGRDTVYPPGCTAKGYTGQKKLRPETTSHNARSSLVMQERNILHSVFRTLMM